MSKEFPGKGFLKDKLNPKFDPNLEDSLPKQKGFCSGFYGPTHNEPWSNLDDYIWPMDFKQYQFLHKKYEQLKKDSKGTVYEKFFDKQFFDFTHGAEHTHRVLEICQQIMGELSTTFDKKKRLLIENKSGESLNQHLTYLMAGIHDFWRITDVFMNPYDAGKMYFWNWVIGKPRRGAGMLIHKIIELNEKRYVKMRRSHSILEYTTDLYLPSPEKRWTLQKSLFEVEEAMKTASHPDTSRRDKDKLEKKSLMELKKVHTLMRGFPHEYRAEILQHVYLLESHIKFRKKLQSGSKSHQTGPRDMFWYFLMMGYPSEWIKDIVQFVMIHDEKAVVPDTLEGKIAQDGDIIDSIGVLAVEKTIDYGKRLDNVLLKLRTIDCKSDYLSLAKEKLHWESKIPIDTFSVILCLRYKWPFYLNTLPGEHLAAQRMDEMEKYFPHAIKKYQKEIVNSFLKDLDDEAKSILESNFYGFWIERLKKIKSWKKMEPDNYEDYPIDEIDDYIKQLKKEQLPVFLIKHIKEKLIARFDSIIHELNQLFSQKGTDSSERRIFLNDAEERLESLREDKLRKKRKNLRDQIEELREKKHSQNKVSNLRSELNDSKCNFSDKKIKKLSSDDLVLLHIESINFEKNQFKKKLTEDNEYLSTFFMKMAEEYHKRTAHIIKKNIKEAKTLQKNLFAERFWDGFGTRMGHEDYWTRMYQNISLISEEVKLPILVPSFKRIILEKLLNIARQEADLKDFDYSKLSIIELRIDIKTTIDSIEDIEKQKDLVKKLLAVAKARPNRREALDIVFRMVYHFNEDKPKFLDSFKKGSKGLPNNLRPYSDWKLTSIIRTNITGVKSKHMREFIENKYKDLNKQKPLG